MTTFINTADYQYLYSTVRIEGFTKAKKSITGTGFYFNFVESETHDLIAIVTNRHVLKDVVEATIKIILLDEKEVSHDTKPLSLTITDLDKKVIYHPNPDIDLCALPLALVIDQTRDIPKGWKLALYAYSKNDLPSPEEFDELTAIEDIIMIGYPDGLMDEVNNKPIIKKGITSTHIMLDYENEKMFLIDMYCFEGSSGSPVLLYKYGVFEADGDSYIGRRTRFLGVLFAGHDTPVEGKLARITLSKLKPVLDINMHIGLVHKAELVLELGSEIEKNSA